MKKRIFCAVPDEFPSQEEVDKVVVPVKEEKIEKEEVES